MDKAGGIAYCFDVIEAADNVCGLKGFVRVCNHGCKNGRVSSRGVLFEKTLAKYSTIGNVDSTSRIIDRTFCWGEIGLLFKLQFSHIDDVVDTVIKEKYSEPIPEDEDEDEDFDLWEDGDIDDDDDDDDD